MRSSQKNLLVATAELLRSSDKYENLNYRGNSIVTTNREQSPPISPFYSLESNKRNTLGEEPQKRTSEEMNFYKNKLLQNKNDNNFNRIEGRNTHSNFSSKEYGNGGLSSKSNNRVHSPNYLNNHKGNKNIPTDKRNNDIMELIKNNSTNNHNDILDNDNRLRQLEETKKKLMNQSKDIEKQLNDLTQYASNSNNILIKRNENFGNNNQKRKYSETFADRIRIDINKTHSREHSKDNNIKKNKLIPKKKAEDYKTQINKIEQLLLKDKIDKNLLLTKLTTLTITLDNIAKQLEDKNRLEIDKKKKKIERLEKENRELKERVSKVKQIMK